MSGPKRIVLEYEDGTRREAPFSKLSGQTQAELSSLGTGDAAPTAKNFLLLQWKDGWKEVAAVDGRATELLRYYTLERVEEVGRLSLDVVDAYPELLLIKRLPGRVENILFVGKESLQTYALEEKVTVKEGGKVEHILYDRKRPNFKMEDSSAASERFAAVLGSLKEELQKKGLRGSAVVAMSGEERTRLYRDLARALGLRGNRQQQDVYGFLQLAIEKLDETHG
ncbi:MAG: hypothetical protein ABSC19_17030 [Syntrophorhabdales bacterium]|jgi:hypothetical protein